MSRFKLDDLADLIKQRAQSGGEASYTRKLLDKGAVHCARKMGEEAVEAIIAATQKDKKQLTAESADVLYHLFVLLEASGIPLRDVEAELERRTAMSGLEEKASRKNS
jgi:phosphoribosyl-ATP pyrophosphohydrolase